MRPSNASRASRRAPAKKARRARTAKPGPPKVFLSHASEDKAFVLDFAARLRKRGIDLWLDRWEILPGDSFVDKIFDEGIAQAKAVIVIISRHSAGKPWVREELNVAIVRKINKVSKLIPVVIDDCKVPNVLQATLWERIGDLKDYAASLDRIVLSIFGQTDKPSIGEQPAFARKPVPAIGDLTRVDSLILQTACEIGLEDGYNLQVLATDLSPRARKLGISEEATWESVRILRNRGYLKEEWHSTDVAPHEIRITLSGFEEYLKVHRPDYESLLRKFASRVLNKEMWTREGLRKSLKAPYVLVDHIVEVFEERKWIIVDHVGGGDWEIAEGPIAPEMKRWLES